MSKHTRGDAAEETGKALSESYAEGDAASPLSRAYYMGWCARGGWEKTNPKSPLIAAAPELLEVMKRALALSKEHADFKLYAMEPFEAAIAKAEGK